MLAALSSLQPPSAAPVVKGGAREEPMDVVVQLARSMPEVVKALLPAVQCADGGGGNINGFGW
jgi:hypothetical protein